MPPVGLFVMMLRLTETFTLALNYSHTTVPLFHLFWNCSAQL